MLEAEIRLDIERSDSTNNLEQKRKYKNNLKNYGRVTLDLGRPIPQIAINMISNIKKELDFSYQAH